MDDINASVQRLRTGRPMAGDTSVVSPHDLDEPQQIRSRESVRSQRSVKSVTSDVASENGTDDGVKTDQVPSEYLTQGKELTPTQLQEMPAWKRFLFSKWGCAVLLTLLTVIILLMIRPAFFLRKRENLMEKPRTNWLVVFFTTIVLFAAFAGIPALVTYCKRRWVGKATE